MANVVPADRTAADKAGDFGEGLGYETAVTSGGETLDARATLETLGASVTIADAGSYTSATTVEAALQEVYARLPFAIDQGEDLIIDTTVGTGTDLRATSLVAPVKASRLYAVRAFLYLTGTANSGYKFGFTGPTDATMEWTSILFDAADSTVLGAINAITDADGATAALTEAPVLIEGVLTVSTTAGNLTVVAAQNVDHADDTVVHAASTLIVTPLQ